MPRISERQELLQSLDGVAKVMAMFDDDCSKKKIEILDLHAAVLSTRFLNLRCHVRKNRSMNEMMCFYEERDFKHIARMSKVTRRVSWYIGMMSDGYIPQWDLFGPHK